MYTLTVTLAALTLVTATRAGATSRSAARPFAKAFSHDRRRTDPSGPTSCMEAARVSSHWNDSAINVVRQAEQALDARCCGFGPHADYH